MTLYIVYYEDREIFVNKKPKQEDHPGALFAEGPLKDKDACIARLRWMGRRAS